MSDARFSRDGRYIIARDYLTLKLYDVNMDSQPLRTIHIHEHLSSRLCELYETDSIFDKFEVSVSCDGSSLMTGSYGGLFKVYDWSGKTEHTLEASRNVQRKSKKGLSRLGRKRDKRGDDSIDTIDYNSKVLHGAFHPHENTLAVASANNLYIYHAS